MTTTERVRPVPNGVKELRNGDRMSAEMFHRVYSATPEDFKAELIGGVVYVASPLGLDHAVGHSDLNGLLWTYARATPGTQCGDAATVLLGPDGEPQPDVILRILPECGGQSTTAGGKYVNGPPELVAEVAVSSWAIDLGAKYDDYRRYGVREYLVLDLHERVLRWFDLTADAELSPDADGVIRAKQFPGLWLHAAAVLAGDYPTMRATLEAGMGTEGYREFVERLAPPLAQK